MDSVVVYYDEETAEPKGRTLVCVDLGSDQKIIRVHGLTHSDGMISAVSHIDSWFGHLCTMLPKWGVSAMSNQEEP